MTAERRTEILFTRNISGLVLLGPDSHALEVAINTDELSVVAIGECASPRVHCVATDAFRSMYDLAREVVRRGYIRIGLVVKERRTDMMVDAWQAALRQALCEAPEREMAPVLTMPEWDAATFQDWFSAHVPCLVISPFAEVPAALAAMDLTVPDDVAFVSPLLAQAETQLTGMKENGAEIGAAAVDYVVGLLHRQERGLPSMPKRLLVESQWFAGSTIGRRNTRRMIARKAALTAAAV
jgi:DNA-binding LacI/PurR family transcriptional regulator